MMKKTDIYRAAFAVAIFAAFLSFGCSGDNGSGGTPNNASNNNEFGQQVGETMASVDESGGSSGEMASVYPRLERSINKTFKRLSPRDITPHPLGLFGAAYASTCRSINTFSACSDNVIVRTFDDCTVGLATLSGNVTFTFQDAAEDDTCLLSAEGDSVVRVPDYAVTGLRGATLRVKKTGSYGQKVVRKEAAGAYSFISDGIRRTFTKASGETTFDFTTETDQAITISGTSRANRTIDGGSLRITNNISGVSCSLAPSNVAWNLSCICAVSGSWSGGCSDGEAIAVNITGCGEATLQKGDDRISVDFDRCEAL